MTRFAYAQNNFTSGELSPKLLGRSDLQEYPNGSQILQNNIPLAAGGYTRRPGSQFIKDITADFDPDYDVALYDFVPNRTESYILAIGVDPSSATCIAKMYKQDASYPVGLTACTLNIDGALGPQLLNLYTYGLTTFNEFSSCQVADLLFMCHSSSRVIPIVVVRTDSTTFEMTNYNRAYPYVNESVVETRRTPFQARNTNTSNILTTTGADPVTRTLTASGSGFAPFTSSWVGTWVRLSNGTTELVGYISAYTSTTVVTLTLDNPSYSASNIADSKWAWGSWSLQMGYPKTVALYQSRLHFGGTRVQPSSIWSSAAGNLFLLLNYKLEQDTTTATSTVQYGGPIADSDAFDSEIASDFTGSITYLSSDRYLKIGTSNGEHVLLPVNGILGPNTKTIQTQTFFGSKGVQPVRMSNATIFATRNGKKLEEVTFSEENASSSEREITILADHLVYHGRDEDTQSSSSSEFTKLVYQRDRKCIWITTSNGGLVGVVNNPSGNVLAWFKVVLGGTTKTVEGICSLPSPDGGANDALYMVVNRTIDGATKKYIERIGEDFEQETLYGEFTSSQRDLALCSDSCIIAGSATIGSGATVIAVDHLVGEEVVVTHKGLKLGTYTVDSSGDITIPSEITGFVADKSTIIGLSFTSKSQTMPIEAGAQFGNSQTGIKRVDTLTARLYRTMGGKYSNTAGTSHPFEITASTTLFSGLKKLAWNDSSSEQASVIIEQSDPYPMTVLQLVMRGETKE